MYYLYVLQDFCDNPITLTLQDGVDRGMELMAEFKYWCSEEGQEKKRRNKKSAIANIDIPLPTMQQVRLNTYLLS